MLDYDIRGRSWWVDGMLEYRGSGDCDVDEWQWMLVEAHGERIEISPHD